MNLLCMSDIHGRFDNFAPELMPDADLCVIAGDITNQGRRDGPEFRRSEQWIAALSARFPIFWIPGNHDLGMNNETYHAQDGHLFIHGIEGHFSGYLDASFFGVSMSQCYDMPELASQWCNMTTRREVENAAYERIVPGVDVIVSHNAPWLMLDRAGYKRNADGSWQKRSIGSVPLRHYIEKHQPKLVICGHVHGAAGHLRYGQTDVYNVAEEWRLIEVPAP